MTARIFPERSKATWAAPAAVLPSGRVEPGSGARAPSTSRRNAGSFADRVGLLKMKLKDGGRPGSSRPIRSSARPDSVVVGTSVVASRPPWARPRPRAEAMFLHLAAAGFAVLMLVRYGGRALPLVARGAFAQRS